MTGLEHYREAERLLSQASELDERGRPYFLADSGADVAAAQVHATLALAAATQHVADDEDRIAGCVDESGTRMRVGARPS